MLTLDCALSVSFTKTSTWPEFGEDVPFPGSVRLKFVTAKTIATGVPLPMTSLGVGERMDSVGSGAPRPFEAGIPEATSIPTIATMRATIRAFTRPSFLSS